MADTDAVTAPKDAVKTTPVRILMDMGVHTANAVIELPSDEVAAAEVDGWADSAPAAVAYARKLARAAARSARD